MKFFFPTLQYDEGGKECNKTKKRDCIVSSLASLNTFWVKEKFVVWVSKENFVTEDTLTMPCNDTWFIMPYSRLCECLSLWIHTIWKKKDKNKRIMWINNHDRKFTLSHTHMNIKMHNNNYLMYLSFIYMELILVVSTAWDNEQS